MDFTSHEDNCNCAYHKSDYEKTTLGYALWHAGYFPNKELSLKALQNILQHLILINKENNNFDSLIEEQKQIIKETENFETTEMYKKRGFYKIIT